MTVTLLWNKKLFCNIKPTLYFTHNQAACFHTTVQTYALVCLMMSGPLSQWYTTEYVSEINCSWFILEVNGEVLYSGIAPSETRCLPRGAATLDIRTIVMLYIFHLYSVWHIFHWCKNSLWFYFVYVPFLYQWLNARLQYLHFNSEGDTTVLY